MLASLVALATVVPRVAAADSISASAGIVVDTVAAKHVLDGESDTFVAPLPFVTADVRYRRFSVAAQGLSTFGTLDFGSERTSLGIVLATARYAVVPGVYAGLGLTALNQTTNQDPLVGKYYVRTLVERSHLDGVRYEIGAVRGRTHLDLGFTPSIHGTVFDDAGFTYTSAGPSITGHHVTTDPEVASEFDAAYRYDVPIARDVDAVAGLRYINFIGRVPSPLGSDTDQNRGAPLFSIGFRYHTRSAAP